MDQDGYVKIVGRSKDMIIRGGENIYPREIEEFLYGHPNVRDVQVVGMPDNRYGEEICRDRNPAEWRPDRCRLRPRILSRQDRALQDPAIRDPSRRVPDDGDRQDPEIQAPRPSNRVAGPRGRDRRHGVSARAELRRPGACV